MVPHWGPRRGVVPRWVHRMGVAAWQPPRAAPAGACIPLTQVGPALEATVSQYLPCCRLYVHMR